MDEDEDDEDDEVDEVDDDFGKDSLLSLAPEVAQAEAAVSASSVVFTFVPLLPFCSPLSSPPSDTPDLDGAA